MNRLSQMELRRATKCVLSSESAVSMVRNDLCCSVWREEEEEGEFLMMLLHRDTQQHNVQPQTQADVCLWSVIIFGVLDDDLLQFCCYC